MVFQFSRFPQHGLSFFPLPRTPDNPGPQYQASSALQQCIRVLHILVDSPQMMIVIKVNAGAARRAISTARIVCCTARARSPSAPQLRDHPVHQAEQGHHTNMHQPTLDPICHDVIHMMIRFLLRAHLQHAVHTLPDMPQAALIPGRSVPVPRPLQPGRRAFSAHQQPQRFLLQAFS